MRKIILIGECELNVLFRNDHPWRALPGGILLNSAAALGNRKYDVSFVSEAATDHVGDIIVDFLTVHGVATHSIDRFTEGHTSSVLTFTSDHGDVRHCVRYTQYPQQSFGVVWPRIDPDDIVIFGEFYSIDERLRGRLFDIIKYASERRAIVIYAPAIDNSRVTRITRVMPAILENLEISDIVVTDRKSIATIFNKDDDKAAYTDHISFYSFNHVNVDFGTSSINMHCKKSSRSVAIPGQPDPDVSMSGIIAGIAAAIIDNRLLRENMEHLTSDDMELLLDNALKWSDSAIAAPDNIVESLN